jgi:hypothetical protein
MRHVAVNPGRTHPVHRTSTRYPERPWNLHEVETLFRRPDVEPIGQVLRSPKAESYSLSNQTAIRPWDTLKWRVVRNLKRPTCAERRLIPDALSHVPARLTTVSAASRSATARAIFLGRILCIASSVANPDGAAIACPAGNADCKPQPRRSQAAPLRSLCGQWLTSS